MVYVLARGGYLQIVAVVFGLISSVTACMQTVYAYEALRLARAAAATPPAVTPAVRVLFV
jgi:hypothetical protein